MGIVNIITGMESKKDVTESTVVIIKRHDYPTYPLNFYTQIKSIGRLYSDKNYIARFHYVQVNESGLHLDPVLSMIVCYVSSEDCGQEELTNCARPLQILQSTSELSIAAKKEELEKLCPDLYNGLHCIRSYTRRCMTLQQRNQFNKMYHGTNQVIRDLCKEGQYQDEFLKHAPCLRVVQAEYEVCAKRYQETMAFINQAKSQENVTLTEDESVRTVCCSFTEYLDCSEQAARKTCGEETAQFTRGFLDKMSSTLVKTYCDSYYKGSGRCREFESSASSLRLSIGLVASIFISYLCLIR